MTKHEIPKFSLANIPLIVRAHYNERQLPSSADFIAEPSVPVINCVLAEAKLIAVEEKREFIEWNNASIELKREVLKNPEKYFVFGNIRVPDVDVSELNHEIFIVEYPNILDALSGEMSKGILLLDGLAICGNMVRRAFYDLIIHRSIPGSAGILSDNVFCITINGYTLMKLTWFKLHIANYEVEQ